MGVTCGSGTSLRVVVADNDLDALDLVVLDLRLEGHDIVGAVRDGDEAVRLCHELRPDVLVSDIRMPPGPDGVAVARTLHGQPGLRVVLYTNYSDRRLRDEARRLGATFLVKGQLAALRAAVAGEQTLSQDG